MSPKKINNFDFEEHLNVSVKNYKGDYKEVIRNTGNVFGLCCHLIYDTKLGKREKAMLYKCIAYFVLPRDIYSESTYGAKGFIDDMMLCLYVLNLISKRHGNDLLYDIWDGKPSELKKLLNQQFNKLIKENKTMFESVLSEVNIK